MSADKTGGPAFPVCYQHENLETGEMEVTAAFHGMTLRDWFAGQALNQMLRWEFAEGQEYQDLAEQAYMAAAAMLAEREKGQP